MILNMYSIKDASRAPQGARGLKFLIAMAVVDGFDGRAPQGARGLKSKLCRKILYREAVAPRKGRVG